MGVDVITNHLGDSISSLTNSCAALQQHRFTYNEPMPVESCTQSLCDLALQFGEDDEEGGMVSLFDLLKDNSTMCPAVPEVLIRIAIAQINV
jgi:hypothetical protein